MNESQQRDLLHLLRMMEDAARNASSAFVASAELGAEARAASPLVLAQALPGGRMAVNGNGNGQGAAKAQQAAHAQQQANAALNRLLNGADRLMQLLGAVQGGEGQQEPAGTE